MSKKKAKKTELKPYWNNPNISVFYELEFGKEIIVPGTNIKIKNARGSFKFIKMVHNSNKDVTWIDCVDNSTGEFKSFYIDRLKSIIKNKRSRDKVVGT